MQRLWLALATATVALAPALAQAEPRGEAKKAPELSPAQLVLDDVEPVSCVSSPEDQCDWVLPAAATASLPAPEPQVLRVRILGITLCSAPSPSGPACEVAWVPPMAAPAAPAWRDWPEMRIIAQH